MLARQRGVAADWDALQQEADHRGEVAWEIHVIDSKIVRAYQHAASAQKSTAAVEALGRSRGWLTTKFHARVDEKGYTFAFALTSEQQHDATMAEALMQQWAIL